MALDIVMPALSPTMESGTLARWLVKIGDAVVPGDVIAEVETDKATMEIEAVDAGVIRSLLVADGTEDVSVGEVIARIGENGEVPHDMPSSIMAGPISEDAPADAVEVVAAPKPGYVLAETTDGDDQKYGGELTVASPLAAKLARARGISLAAIVGTGPNGRIVKADIIPEEKVIVATKISQTRAPARVIANDPVPTDVPMRAVKLSSMRRTIARRLTESKQTVPHFYLTVDVDLDSLLTLRTQLNAAAAEGHPKISVNDLIIRALGVALMEVPEANVQYTEDQLYFFNRADIAVAVAVDGGLITPVVRDAGSKSASAIAREMKRLSESARAGQLLPEEYLGGTASLSNLGMYGIKQFDAVINPPQAMILAVGICEQRSVVRGGELAIATVASITGSFDHRAIDGAVGASMMAALKRLIEAPLTMLA